MKVREKKAKVRKEPRRRHSQGTAAFEVGPSLAKAWVVTVINPILDGLRTGRYRLAQKNWSWRYRTGGFEYIWPIAGYVEVRYHANYEEFCRCYPRAARLISQHDEQLNRLAEALNQAYEQVLHLPRFQDTFRQAKERYEANFAQVWGGLPEQDGPKLVAEHILNNITEPLYGYTDQSYWEQFGSEFLALREDPALRPTVEEIGKLGEQLARLVDALEIELKSLRSEYARKFDIPPVPVESEGW